MDEGIVDVATAKALANPLRQRIQRELDILGEATATVLAARLEVTTGATSYNLRVLARHGLVQEVPELAKGRERWWRPVRKDLRFPRQSEQSAQLRAAVEELHQAWLVEDLDSFTRFQQHRAQLGPWSDALPYSRGSIKVNMDELREFFEEYLRLIKRFQRPDSETPPGARTVQTRFIAFPDPDAFPDTQEGTTS